MKSLYGFCVLLLLNSLFACSSSGEAAPSDTGHESMSANATGTTSTGTTSTGSTTGTTTGQGSVSTTAAASTGTSATGTGTTGTGTTGTGTTGTGTSGSVSTTASGGAVTTGTSQASSSSTDGDGTNTGMSTTASASTSTSTTGGVAACESGALDAPIPDCSPTPVPDTGDFYADCVARINQFRWECQCLPPLERWVEAEDCADQQAEYDAMLDEAHAGIRAGICEPSNAGQNECLNYGPSFGILDFCLQQMWDEGPGEDFQVHGHYLNMSDASATRVGCGIYVAPNGDVTSVQNFQ